MKRFVWLSILSVWILSACAGGAQPTEQSFIPIDGLRPTPTQQVELTPAERAAVSRLSSVLNLPPEEISVVSTEAVEWPDGCLGVQRPGVMCTQAIVPGYRIILQAGDEQLEFRTNESGSQVVQVGSDSSSSLLEEAIVAQLASNLGLDAGEISVLSSSDVEFPDSCLGVEIQDVPCAEVITPGKIIVLEANDLQFEYRVSADGSRVQPATLALVWTREGGIAGFCNRLTVFLSGEVYASDCRSEQSEGTMKLFADVLSATEQQQFFEWIQEFEQVSLDASDPKGVSDRMLVTLEFYGSGESQPTKAEQQALFEFAQNLYLELFQ